MWMSLVMVTGPIMRKLWDKQPDECGPWPNLWQNHKRTWGQILSLFSFPHFHLLLFSIEKSVGKRGLEDTVQRTNRSRESRPAHKESLISHQFPWLAQCCRLVNLRVDSEKMNLQGIQCYEVWGVFAIDNLWMGGKEELGRGRWDAESSQGRPHPTHGELWASVPLQNPLEFGVRAW